MSEVEQRQTSEVEQRQTSDPPHESRGRLAASISDELVRLHKEFHGRGPEKARTYYMDDVILCLMGGGFERVEQSLLESGRAAAVAVQRREFQDMMQERFRAVVERLTGRKVLAVMADSHQHPDLVVEVFILESALVALEQAD